MDMDLNGKRAIVCGSSQGIGKSCAIELARMGASISLLARHAEALVEARSSLPSDHGKNHKSLQADFSEWESVRDAANEHVRSHGPVHILINNTGGPPAGPAFEATADAFLKAFEMHLLCNQALVQAVAPGMRDAKYGRIINIISTSVITPIKGLGVSNTIRGAVANWARTLAAELAPFDITVNNVLPGYTATTRLGTLIQGRANRAGVSPHEIEEQMKASVPMRRFGEPEEIASVVAFLASPAASYVSGVNLPVDGARLAAQ
jgi:3-oxoacyl-[acyl-carrier protein] reductase